MVKHQRHRIICLCLLISILSRPLIAFQVHDAHSSFIDNVTLTSNFSNYGMPVDDYSTDTSIAASSQKNFTLEIA